jgi:hypothetical protein
MTRRDVISGTGTIPRHLAWTNQSHANRMFYLACGLYKRDSREKSLFDDHASNGSTVSGHNRIDISNNMSTRDSMRQSLKPDEDELLVAISILHDHYTGTLPFAESPQSLDHHPVAVTPFLISDLCAIISKQRSTHDEHDAQQARPNLFDFDFLARVDHSFS